MFHDRLGGGLFDEKDAAKVFDIVSHLRFNIDAIISLGHSPFEPAAFSNVCCDEFD